MIQAAENINKDKMTSLSKENWLAFLRRNCNKIIIAYGIYLDASRANFSMICDLICKQFLEASICAESAEAKIHDSEGNIINNKDNIVELLIKYELIHPDYLLIVGKVGSNLHCDYDNNTSGEKYILRVGNDYTTIKSDNNDYRFSMLGCASTNRQSTIYVVIIKAERLSYEQI